MAEYLTEHVDRDSDRLGLHVYPAPRTDSGLVVIFPAMGVPARYYRPFAAELMGNGLWPVVADLRGTGDSTPRPSRASRYGYAELAEDVGAVLDHLKDRRDGRTTVLLGHSLGGQASLLHLAGPNASTVDGVILVAVGLPYWRRYPGRRALGVGAFTQAVGAVAAVLRVSPGWSFGGRQARGIIRDWAFTARHGRYPSTALESALSTVRTAVFAVTVEQDMYTPAAVTEILLDKLAAAQIERHHYAVAEAGAPLDHFRWVRASAPLARRVADFMARR